MYALKTKKLMQLILMISACLTLANCGAGFEASEELVEGVKTSSQDAGDSSGGPDDPGAEDPDAPGLPELDGKVSGGVWDGKEIFALDLDRQELIIKLPIDFDAMIVGGQFPIPGYSDVVLEMWTLPDGSKEMRARIPLARILGNEFGFNETGLPNGDPLPMVPGGVLPRTDFNIGDQEIYFYLGLGTIAVFVPTSFNPYVTLVFPIKNEKEQVLGYFATIAEREPHNGGFYAALQLPENILQALGEYLPGSKN